MWLQFRRTGVWLLALALSWGVAESLVVMTPGSFSISKPLVEKFEKANHIQLKFVQTSGAIALLNKAILSKGAPIADVIYGWDNTVLDRALSSGILEQYLSPEIKDLKSAYLLDPTFHALPVNYGFVNFNYDKAYFRDHPLPTSLAELQEPAYAKLLVVENPAISITGLDFLITTVYNFGENGYLRFWAALRAGDVKVAKGWSAAYYSDFSLYGGGRPLVLSYNTSPAAELYYSKGKDSVPPIGNLLFKNSAFAQVEFVGILKGTRHRKAAEKFVNWLLSKPVQEDIPTQMWVYPVRRDAVLPEVFTRWAPEPYDQQQMSATEEGANVSRWIHEWTEVVLQRMSPKEVIAARKK